jgi:hypothetical protein
MVILIKKEMVNSEIKEMLKKGKQKFNKERESQLKKHFGALERGLDGLEYQNKMRDDWK